MVAAAHSLAHLLLGLLLLGGQAAHAAQVEERLVLRRQPVLRDDALHGLARVLGLGALACRVRLQQRLYGLLPLALAFQRLAERGCPRGFLQDRAGLHGGVVSAFCSAWRRVFIFVAADSSCAFCNAQLAHTAKNQGAFADRRCAAPALPLRMGRVFVVRGEGAGAGFCGVVGDRW